MSRGGKEIKWEKGRDGKEKLEGRNERKENGRESVTKGSERRKGKGIENGEGNYYKW